VRLCLVVGAPMTKDTQTRLLKALADLDAQRKISNDLAKNLRELTAERDEYRDSLVKVRKMLFSPDPYGETGEADQALRASRETMTKLHHKSRSAAEIIGRFMVWQSSLAVMFGRSEGTNSEEISRLVGAAIAERDEASSAALGMSKQIEELEAAIHVPKCDCFKPHHGTAGDPSDRHHPDCGVHDE